MEIYCTLLIYSPSVAGGTLSESADIITEAVASIQSDAFVAVSCDDLIPNNVELSSDQPLQRAPEGRQPQ